VQKCALCNYSTIYSHRVDSHRKTVHDGIAVDLSCKHCDYRGEDHPSLEDHISSLHGHVDHAACQKCGFGARHGPTMGAHVKTIHSKKLNSKNKHLQLPPLDKCNVEVVHVQASEERIYVVKI
jgi:NAD-dependent SIR2 family protein deacetylase